MTDRKLTAALAIGRPSGSGPEIISVRITDETSGVQFCSLEVPLADFARCLTGLHTTKVPMILRWLDRVGMRHEHKEEEVFLADFGRNDAAKRTAVASHEIEGWSARLSDLGNHHRITRRQNDGSWYTVTFHRHVNPETEEPAP